MNVEEWLYSEYESNPIKLEVNLNKEGKRKAESMSWLRDNMEYNSDGTAKITKILPLQKSGFMLTYFGVLDMRRK
ncbi:hypothetical protein [Bacillus pseudomycoides]|uniref:hypothetical protein n=1 Tax=Bacillus pseudomycoides TaxID=64104 RepID=UPI0021003360|nr:hypothetical protein [Bacillus pseudomycoides]